MGPIGGIGEAAKGQPRAPPPKSELDKEGGRRPPFPFPLSLLPSPLLLQHGKGGVLLPVGVGVTPTMRLYLPRVGARLRGITA